MRVDRGREERSRRCDVVPFRDEHVDDLAVVVDGPVNVPPHAGDFDVGLIDEPPQPDRMPARSGRMPARSGRVDQQRCEVLHPPIQRSRDRHRRHARRGARRDRDTTTRSGGTSGPPARSPPAGAGTLRTQNARTTALDDGDASRQRARERGRSVNATVPYCVVGDHTTCDREQRRGALVSREAWPVLNCGQETVTVVYMPKA
jgi:hypothetical protein